MGESPREMNLTCRATRKETLDVRRKNGEHSPSRGHTISVGVDGTECGPAEEMAGTGVELSELRRFLNLGIAHSDLGR